MKAAPAVENESIHGYFGLTYANYLVLHRSFLQSMPDEWQTQFVRMLRQLDDAFQHVDKPDMFRVHATTWAGRYAKDPVPHYNRGRTFIEPRMH